jgi:glycerol-3-phosphate acyltransferase PlsY
MINTSNLVLLLISYLLGSIPSAVWIGKYFYNIDVREYGSGNAGATNTIRVLGKKAGIPVLIIDALKGFGAVSLAVLSPYTHDSNQFVNLQLVLGIASLVGHIFPVFASFRGGKGIATLLGITVAVNPMAACFSIIIFIVMLVAFGYVSLGSITAAIAFPISILFVLKVQTPSLILFSILVAIMVVITHQKNIERLLKREEPKANLLKRKKDDTTDAENNS